MNKLGQVGDTIVEVMISIMVIAAILSGAFLVSRASSKNVQDSQEHTRATNLLQGQIELLRGAALSGKHGPELRSVGKKFCMDTAGNVVPTSDSACQKDNLYSIVITNKGQDAVGTYTYKAQITWDSINGGKAEVDLSYKIGVV